MYYFVANFYLKDKQFPPPLKKTTTTKHTHTQTQQQNEHKHYNQRKSIIWFAKELFWN